MYESLRWKIPLILVLLVAAILELTVGTLNLGFDLKGGVELRYKIDTALTGEKYKKLTDEERTRLKNRSERVAAETQKTLEVIRRRLDPTGTIGPDIRSERSGEIIIRLPSLSPTEVESIKKRAESMGKLELRMIIDDSEYETLSDADKEDIERKKMTETRINPDTGKKEETQSELWVKMSDQYNVTGDDISSVREGQDRFGAAAVNFTLNPEGANKFYELTKYLADKGTRLGRKQRLGILLNNELQSAPNVSEGIAGGRAQITGKFTDQEIKDLIAILQAGSLPTSLKLESEVYVGPELGTDSRDRGYFAVQLAFVLVVVFMGVYYLISGAIADLALALNLVLLLAAMMLTGSVMTLPGIAGIILTVGMAVDANVLIYERVREELHAGHPLRFAVRNGYDRAFTTILDANLTTLITAVILYWQGSGPVRGFAVTLSIGIVASMFTALFVTRTLFDFLISRGILKERLPMMRLFSNPRLAFVRYAPLCIAISVILILAGMGVFIYRGHENYGIDFSSGTAMQLKLNKTMDIKDVRRRVADAGYPGADVQTAFGDKNVVGERESNQFAIRVRSAGVELTQEQREDVLRNIENAFADIVDHRSIDVQVDETKLLGPPSDDNQPVEVLKATGTEVKLEFNEQTTDAEGKEITQPVPMRRDQIVASLKKAGYGDVKFEWPPVERKSYYDVTFTTPVTDEAKIRKDLEGQGIFTVPDAFMAVNFVGPGQAAHIVTQAWAAAILSLIAIIFYIWLRFGAIKYGLAAVAALVHDVLFTLGVLAVFAWLAQTPVGEKLGIGDVRLSLPIVAGILTIIGYSLNDTIVVFDRIRENVRRRIRALRGGRGGTVLNPEIIDTSVNQTLARTVLTSFTTLLVCLTLYIVGGITLHGLALCLIIGVVVGTYSSIFIASPILVIAHAWEVRRARKTGALTTEERDVAGEETESEA